MSTLTGTATPAWCLSITVHVNSLDCVTFKNEAFRWHNLDNVPYIYVKLALKTDRVRRHKLQVRQFQKQRLWYNLSDTRSNAIHVHYAADVQNLPFDVRCILSSKWELDKERMCGLQALVYLQVSQDVKEVWARWHLRSCDLERMLVARRQLQGCIPNKMWWMDIQSSSS